MPKEYKYFQSRKPIDLGKEFLNYLLLEAINKKSLKNRREDEAEATINPPFSPPPSPQEKKKKVGGLKRNRSWQIQTSVRQVKDIGFA